VGWCDGVPGKSVYVESKVLFREYEREQMLWGHDIRGSLSRLVSQDSFLKVNSSGALKTALWSDRHLYLANDLTYKMDIALSSQGIEGRSPLLDHALLEWTQSLPANDLVCGRQKKVVLRKAYAAQLPPEVATRGKHGFGAPVNRWLAGPLANLREQLSTKLLGPCAGTDGQRQWSLLTFACWAEAWGARW
jgi:asparagine synthetase B (glutamine-hydrolysing)